jgi:hypothetical protein
MGVEYRQNFVVKDLDWLPSADTAERIDAVLRKWQIVHGLKSTDLFPSGAATLYQWDTDGIPGAMIERVAGPSIYEAEIESRYIDVISLLIGTDFHVHRPSETMSVDVITGPVVDGEELPATGCDDVAHYVVFETFSNSSAGSHPVADVDFIELEPENGPFAGVWRAALIFDYNKDLPASAMESPLIHNREFARDISEAFGTELIEFGEGD